MMRRLTLTTATLLCLAPALMAQEATTPATAQEAPQQTITLAALQAAAQEGNPDAQLALATLYHQGTGVLQNYARAAALYRAAAEAGSAMAQNALGKYYHEGLGVDADPEAALRWLGAAADQGAPQHAFDLATVLEASGDDAALTRAVTLYTQAADAGLAEAVTSLGVLYQEGRGVDQDFERARTLYEAAAEAGLPRAQNNLGLLLVRGDGVEQDYARAVTLFSAATEAGLAEAATNLGVMYENGFGVAQNDETAAQLYRLGGQAEAVANAELPRLVYDNRLAPPRSDAEALSALQAAARAGDPVAAFQLGYVLAGVEGASADQLRVAAALFRQGAEAGHGAAMVNLGLAHIHGRGVVQDFAQGQMWLILAANVGLPEAQTLGQMARSRMTSGQLNDAQAMAEAAWQARRP